VQELDEVTLLRLHRSDSFQLSTMCIAAWPPFFPGKIPNCHSIHQFPVAIDGPTLNPPGTGEDHLDESLPNTLYILSMAPPTMYSACDVCWYR
jgi:hypothetical protein